MSKRMLSIVLAIILSLSMTLTAPAVSAAESQQPSAIESNVTGEELTVTGTNSIGTMLASEYDQYVDEKGVAQGNQIFDIQIKNTTAYVDVQVFTKALLVVSIVDEDGSTVYGTGQAEIDQEDISAEINLEVDTMPEYYLIRAYLLDSMTNIPLCKQFECDTYTQKMQEFLAKTTDDFDEERVVNLDNDNTKNFLVFDDNTIIIDNKDSHNTVSSANNEEKQYVIENIDNQISSLQSGDIFALPDKDDYIIVKVSSISIDGTTATIIGEDIELADAFNYIKIDTKQSTADCSVDNSNLQDGIEYVGKGENESSSNHDIAPTGLTIDDEISTSESLKYKLKELEIGAATISADFGCDFEINVKCYFDGPLFGEKDVEFSFAIKYDIALSASLEISTERVQEELRIELGDIGYMPFPGVFIGFTPSIVLEGKVSIELSGTLSGQIGKSFKNGVFEDNSKKATFTAEIKIEAELFIGLSLEPKVEILGCVVEVKAEAKAGVMIKACMQYSATTNAEEIHECSACIEGEMDFKIDLSVSLSIIDGLWEWEAGLFSFTQKISDFYYSFDTHTFAFTSCPNYSYRQTITVVDKNIKPIVNADVNGVKTNSQGQAVLHLTKGDHKIIIDNGDHKNANIISVTEAADIQFIFDKETYVSSPAKPAVIDTHEKGTVSKGSCGEMMTYVIYADGTMVISGNGEMKLQWFLLQPWIEYRNFIKKIEIRNGVERLANWAFQSCENLESVTLPNTLKYIGEYCFNDCKKLKSITIPESVTEIGSLAFCECYSLESIEIPNRVKTINEGTFGDCTGLKTVILPNSLETICSNAFYKCTALKTLVIPKSVTTIENHAFGSSGLESVVIPDTITSINAGLFSGCNSLSSVTLPNNLSSISASAFQFCSALKSISLPASVTYIGKSAFEGSGLESISIPEGVTKIDDDAFYYCENLTNMFLPDSLTEIGAGAFSLCKFESIRIPESVTQISAYTFDRCFNLKQIRLPEGIKTIQELAFGECENLSDVYYSGTKEQWDNIPIEEGNEILNSVTVHCLALSPTGSNSDQAVSKLTALEINDLNNHTDKPSKQEIAPVSATDEKVNEFSRGYLVPDSEAVLVIVESTKADFEIHSKKILYIAQTTVDYLGEAYFQCSQEFIENDWIAYIFGQCTHSQYHYSETYDSLSSHKYKSYVCDHCGEILEFSMEENDNPNERILGDADGDGTITILDATYIQRYLVSLPVPGFCAELADVSGDGIDITDATYIQRWLANIDVPYPIGEIIN